LPTFSDLHNAENGARINGKTFLVMAEKKAKPDIIRDHWWDFN